jgi:hypothetical protein
LGPRVSNFGTITLAIVLFIPSDAWRQLELLSRDCSVSLSLAVDSRKLLSRP